jgi:hypothetical protein
VIGSAAKQTERRSRVNIRAVFIDIIPFHVEYFL